MYNRAANNKPKNMGTLQLSVKDYGKYALFEVSDKDGDIMPVFLSFDLNEVVDKAKELKKKGTLSNPAIEQVQDPHVCWSY